MRIQFGQTDVYGRLLFDNTTGKFWNNMTDAERKASSINIRRVVLTGQEATADLPSVLSLGTPLFRVNSPASVAGVYAIGASAFGPQLSSPGVTGDVVIGLDPADAAGPSTTDGCEPFTNGCTIKDFVNQAAAAAGNHGNFVSAIAHLSDSLKSAGLISGSQKGKMLSCAAGAAIP